MLDLVDILADAGCTVTAQPGWETRTASGPFAPFGAVWHHTAGPRAGDAPSLGLCIEKNLTQLLLARSGRWHVISGRKSNHAGLGVRDVLSRLQQGLAPQGDARDHYRWPLNLGTIFGNEYFLGIEIENDGVSEPYPAVQLDALERGTAAIFRAYRWSAHALIAHREWTARKPDPHAIDMPAARAVLARRIAGTPTPPPPQEDLDVARHALSPRKGNDPNARPHAVLSPDGNRIVLYNGARLQGDEPLGRARYRKLRTPASAIETHGDQLVVYRPDGTTRDIAWA